MLLTNINTRETYLDLSHFVHSNPSRAVTITKISFVHSNPGRAVTITKISFVLSNPGRAGTITKISFVHNNPTSGWHSIVVYHIKKPIRVSHITNLLSHSLDRDIIFHGWEPLSVTYNTFFDPLYNIKFIFFITAVSEITLWNSLISSYDKFTIEIISIYNLNAWYIIVPTYLCVSSSILVLTESRIDNRAIIITGLLTLDLIKPR